ncbi:MAG TPA: hypothetical protein VFB16_04140 [Bauldia sp.]|nr:hypothetical protein [Bauldia sp.]
MLRIVWTLIGILILIHGYLYIRYQSLDPCEAAVKKVSIEHPEAMGRVMSLLGTRDLGTIGQCYWIAVVGPPSDTTATP